VVRVLRLDTNFSQVGWLGGFFMFFLSFFFFFSFLKRDGDDKLHTLRFYHFLLFVYNIHET
jgi:hypothetical protein